jgi:hypothetical protein
VLRSQRLQASSRAKSCQPVRVAFRSPVVGVDVGRKTPIVVKCSFSSSPGAAKYRSDGKTLGNMGRHGRVSARMKPAS